MRSFTFASGWLTRLTAIAAAFAFSHAPGTARADDWTNLGLDGTRSRLSAEISGSRFDAGGWMNEWKSEPQVSYRAIVATPAIGDGFLVYGTQRNLVRTLDETNGQVAWEAAVGGTVMASPAIWRGLVFILGTNQQLHALSLADGAPVWQKDIGGAGYGSPIVVDGSLYVVAGAPATRLWRLDPDTGRIIWQTNEGVLDTSVVASVAVAGGHAVVTQMEGQVLAFGVDDGQLQWKADTHGRVTVSSPLVLPDRIYVLPVAEHPRLWALDPSTGQSLEGWPLDVDLPAAPASFGSLRERRFVVSSVAGANETLAFTVRSDDYFGADSTTGQPDSFFSQEALFAVDGSRRSIKWASPIGTLESKDPNDVPNFEQLGTPALYRTEPGEDLIATVSSLAPAVRVFAGNGDARWSRTLAAPTRSSPVFANGRLVVATDAGIVQSFLSAINQPPVAPVLGLEPASGSDTDAAHTVLAWGDALDPEGQAVRYQVRLDDDGEVLRDWDLETMGDGESNAVTLPPLAAGTYTFSIRARDMSGAWSAWTTPQTFHAVGSPAVTVDGVPAGSLSDALAMAKAGGIVRLGAGFYALERTLEIPAGVTLEGAAPHLTTVSGKGLAVALTAAAGSEIHQLTVTGAGIGVRVDEARAARLRNVILRDNAEVGLDVTATGAAELVSATLIRNGSAVRSAGTVNVKNTLVTLNDVGLDAIVGGQIQSRYNNLWQNRLEDYRGTVRDASDLAAAVAFDAPEHELRVQAAQPTTDRGDPLDDFSSEPLPNGRRINIGAFGNTQFAELSVASTTADAGADADIDAGPGAPVSEAGGDGCACSVQGRAPSPATIWIAGMAATGVLARRRRRK